MRLRSCAWVPARDTRHLPPLLKALFRLPLIPPFARTLVRACTCFFSPGPRAGLLAHRLVAVPGCARRCFGDLLRVPRGAVRGCSGLLTESGTSCEEERGLTKQSGTEELQIHEGRAMLPITRVGSDVSVCAWACVREGGGGCVCMCLLAEDISAAPTIVHCMVP